MLVHFVLVMKKNLHELINVVLTITDEKDMRNFFEGIFTPNELEEIPTRLQIIKMLKKGVSQHEIAEKLGVGIATVTRGATEIKKGRFKTIL